MQHFEHEKILLATVFAGQAEYTIQTTSEKLKVQLTTRDLLFAH
jgi:hypothetical protein